MRFGDPVVSQNPRGVCASHSLGQILGCAYTIFLYGQTSPSCTIPSGSLAQSAGTVEYTDCFSAEG